MSFRRFASFDIFIASLYEGHSLMSRIRSHAKTASNAGTTCDVLDFLRFFDVSSFSTEARLYVDYLMVYIAGSQKEIKRKKKNTATCRIRTMDLPLYVYASNHSGFTQSCQCGILAVYVGFSSDAITVCRTPNHHHVCLAINATSSTSTHPFIILHIRTSLTIPWT